MNIDKPNNDAAIEVAKLQKDRHSEKVRDYIQEMRKQKGLLEKEVNSEYYRVLTEMGLSAPRAVMTQVRDKRKDFVLTKQQAEAMAEALGKVDPTPLYPPESNQPDLLEAIMEKALVKAEPEFSDHVDEVVSLPEARDKAKEEREEKTVSDSDAKSTTKAMVGIYETAAKGLGVFVNMDLTAAQYERLTLAIPSYMMKVEMKGDLYHVQTKVEIFPYQAEIIMRAIFGGTK